MLEHPAGIEPLQGRRSRERTQVARRRFTEDEENAIRSRIVEAARRQIEADGLAALKARALAEGLGMATGKIYSYFADLDAVVVAVNSQTLARLDATIVAALPDRNEAPPREVLVGLALAYHRFAVDNVHLWSALFERASVTMRAPTAGWHLDEHLRLMGYITGALQRLSPTMGEADAWRHARTLLAAVHGIVSTALAGFFVAVPRDQVADELAFLVTRVCDGLQHARVG
nr:TetR-like C-terminal domain-containing protein [Aurantimonas sp. CSK15Z-1]